MSTATKCVITKTLNGAIEEIKVLSTGVSKTISNGSFKLLYGRTPDAISNELTYTVITSDILVRE